MSTDAADGIPEDFPELPKGVTGGGVARAGLNALGGAIPFAGGLFAAAAGAWSEKEQARVNDFLTLEEMREIPSMPFHKIVSQHVHKLV